MKKINVTNKLKNLIMKTRLEIMVVRDNTTSKKPSTAIIIPQNLSSLIYRRWLLIDGNDKLLAEVKQRVLESGKPEKVLITEIKD